MSPIGDQRRSYINIGLLALALNLQVVFNSWLKDFKLIISFRMKRTGRGL